MDQEKYLIIFNLATPVHLKKRAWVSLPQTEETSGWTFRRGTLYLSCLIYNSSCSTVSSLICCIFDFTMCQMLSAGEKSRM